MSQLSAGVCMRLNDAETTDDDLFNSGHTVQFLSIKQVSPTTAGNTSAPDRYRIIISDGEHFLQAMLATQLNPMVHNNDVGKNTVAVIDKMTCNFVQGKKLIIILALSVLSTDEEKIGSPVAIPAPLTTAATTSVTGVPSATVTPAQQVPPQRQQPKSLYQTPAQTRPAASTGRRGAAVFPIEGLSPYQNNWTIKARVTNKSEIKEWSNARGEGKLFNVTLMDDSGEIRGTAFNQVAVDLYEKFEEGKVYFVSKARVNLAKKKFSPLTNDYELSFEKQTEVEECFETTGLPVVKFNFVDLNRLETLEKDQICDVIGVVKDKGEISTIVSKATQKELVKRELTLVDKSGYSVRVTLWGKQAQDYNAEPDVIIALKGAKVGDFGGRTLSVLGSSTMNFNPDVDEAFALRGWYDSGGSTTEFNSYSSNFTPGSGSSGFDRTKIVDLRFVRENGEALADKNENFSSRASIMHVKSDNMYYPACSTTQPKECNKKVLQESDGWRCENCQKLWQKPEYRYIITLAVADWSGQAWFQGFNDVGNAIFGHSANEMHEWKESDELKWNSIVAGAESKTFNFVCRPKSDSYNDQVRIRLGISRIMPLNYHDEASYLRDLLTSRWAQ